MRRKQFQIANSDRIGISDRLVSMAIFRKFGNITVCKVFADFYIWVKHDDQNVDIIVLKIWLTMHRSFFNLSQILVSRTQQNFYCGSKIIDPEQI